MDAQATPGRRVRDLQQDMAQEGHPASVQQPKAREGPRDTLEGTQSTRLVLSHLSRISSMTFPDVFPSRGVFLPLEEGAVGEEGERMGYYLPHCGWCPQGPSPRAFALSRRQEGIPTGRTVGKVI